MQITGVDQSLKLYARLLKLPTFAHLDDPVSRFQVGQSLKEFVLQLMQHEYENRQEKARQRRLKTAHFPMLKTLEEFDLSRLRHISPDFIRQLASCEFIGRHENIVMVGNPGTGKTHLMTAIGIKACLLGYKVIFRTATTLVTELREAKDSYSLRKLEKSIAAADLLLLDELSYASFGLEESELLFKVIAERSERTSTMITTNLEFSKWPEMFKDAALVAALVDRLTYHSHILNMNGESYRFQNARRRKP